MEIMINKFFFCSLIAFSTFAVYSQNILKEIPRKFDCGYHSKYQKKAIAKREVGDYLGALKDFSIAVDSNPNYGNVYGCRASVKMILHDYQGAIDDLTKAIEKIPNDATLYDLRQSARLSIGDKKGAKADSKNAKKYSTVGKYFFSPEALIKPCNTCTVTNYNGPEFSGEICNCNYYDAIIDYDKIIETNPNDTLVFLYRGKAKVHIEDYLGAISDFSVVIKKNPNDSLLYFFRASARQNLKDY